jgi:hypothetical protein
VYGVDVAFILAGHRSFLRLHKLVVLQIFHVLLEIDPSTLKFIIELLALVSVDLCLLEIVV